MIRKILIAVLFVCLHTTTSASEPDQAIHNELRATLSTIAEAINSGDFDKMLPVLSEQIRATPINQETLTSRADVSAYFKKWFGGNGYLKKLEITLKPDTLTELSPDKTWGVVRGAGVEKYILRDGRLYELHTRWTATMVKEADGQWRVRSIHIGTNFMDNPILTEAEKALGWALGGGLAGGLVLGGLISWLLCRRKKKS